MNTKQGVVKWLKDVSTGEVDLGKNGLCHYFVRMDYDSNSRQTRSAILSFMWERMAGHAVEHGTSRAYPVPHPKFGPSDGYRIHSRSGSSMNDESEYGLNRRALAEILADELENSDVG